MKLLQLSIHITPVLLAVSMYLSNNHLKQTEATLEKVTKTQIYLENLNKNLEINNSILSKQISEKNDTFKISESDKEFIKSLVLKPVNVEIFQQPQPNKMVDNSLLDGKFPDLPNLDVKSKESKSKK